MKKARGLEITTSPFTHSGVTTPRVMFEVLVPALLVVAVASYFFGIVAWLVVGTATAGAVGTEWIFIRKDTPGPRLGNLADGSAILTGVLLGLTLPPAMPLWMAFLGGVAAIALGKVIWGGLGQNLFNPALVGRAFLQAAFPTVITTWAQRGEGFFSLPSSTLALPFLHADVDVVTSATPLGLAKFEGQLTDTASLFLGNVNGSLGETSGLVLVVLGLIMAARRVFDVRLPIAALTSVAAFSGLLHLLDPAKYPSPLFMLGSGGLLFAAVFMVTDPVTTPMSKKGSWIFGVGVGILIVLIRLFGGLPEGAMYAVLLMNSVSPLIDRYTQPKPFGFVRPPKKAPAATQEKAP